MSIVSWLKRRRLEEDFEDEIRAHMAIAADERMADGVDRETAHRASVKRTRLASGSASATRTGER